MEAKAATEILLIADDPRWVSLLAGYLHDHGYRLTATSPGGAFQALAGGHFAAMLFELALSGLASLSLLDQLRAESQVPVLALAESEEAAQHLRTLDLGASDYLSLDCPPHALLATLRRVILLGEADAAGHRVVRVRDLLLDIDARTVLLGTQVVELSPVEFTLLLTLAREPGRLYTRERLAAYLGVNPAAVDVHVSAVRRKLHDDVRAPRWVATVRNAGYLMPLSAAAAR